MIPLTDEAKKAGSLPSRGAWIEISHSLRPHRSSRSLPSRGAWIEICKEGEKSFDSAVAPLAGSVDRNCSIALIRQDAYGRSPRGERG